LGRSGVTTEVLVRISLVPEVQTIDVARRLTSAIADGVGVNRPHRDASRLLAALDAMSDGFDDEQAQI
jgi:hypothetical protein